MQESILYMDRSRSDWNNQGAVHETITIMLID